MRVFLDNADQINLMFYTLPSLKKIVGSAFTSINILFYGFVQRKKHTGGRLSFGRS